jgi:hypothetical protein
VVRQPANCAAPVAARHGAWCLALSC